MGSLVDKVRPTVISSTIVKARDYIEYFTKMTAEEHLDSFMEFLGGNHPQPLRVLPQPDHMGYLSITGEDNREYFKIGFNLPYLDYTLVYMKLGESGNPKLLSDWALMLSPTTEQ